MLHLYRQTFSETNFFVKIITYRRNYDERCVNPYDKKIPRRFVHRFQPVFPRHARQRPSDITLRRYNDYGIQVMPSGLGTIYRRSLQPDNGRCHAGTGFIVGRCVLIKIQAITSGKTPLRVRRTSYYFALNAVGARQTGTCVRVYKFIAI